MVYVEVYHGIRRSHNGYTLVTVVIDIIQLIMASTLLVQAIPLGAAMMYVEANLLPESILEGLMSDPSTLVPHISLPKAFGLVIIVNIMMSAVTMTGLGMKVGKARGTYKEKVS